MLEFEKELIPLRDMLNSPDNETRVLGYNFLRESDFKKSMRGKVWSENGKSFYRFNLFAIKDKAKYIGNQQFITYYDTDKLNFAYKVVFLYLEHKLIIRELK